MASFFGQLLVLLLVAGLCIVLVLGSTWLYRKGYLDPAIPKVREVAPVKVNLYGPQVAIKGMTADFHVEISGVGGIPDWTLIAPANATTANLRISQDHKRAEFSGSEEGEYRILVGVGGEGMQVSTKTLTFENVELVSRQEVDAANARADQVEQQAQQRIQAAQQQQQQMAQANAPPPPTSAELAMGALTRVQTQDMPGEARMIAGSIRSVIGKIQTTPSLAFDADPAVMVAEQVQAQIGDRSKNWEFFLVAIGVILKDLRDKGQVTTPITAIPTLNEIANVLNHTH